MLGNVSGPPRRSMLCLRRYPVSFFISGKISVLTIFTGTRQDGLNTIYLRLPEKITVLFAVVPTITFIVKFNLPLSYTYILYSGMFTNMRLGSLTEGIQRSLSRFTNIC